MKTYKLNLDNVVKSSIVVGVLVISLSVFYYLAIFLPKTQKEQAIIEQTQTQKQNQEKCRAAGERAYKSDREEFVEYADYLLDPKFKYSEELNTCLYSSGYRKGDDWERWVKDSYTNSKVISVFYYADSAEDEEVKERQLESIELYWQKHAELFNE